MISRLFLKAQNRPQLGQKSKLKLCFQGFGQKLQPSRLQAGELGAQLCTASHVQGRNILIGKVWGKLEDQEPVKEDEGLRMLGGSGGFL